MRISVYKVVDIFLIEITSITISIMGAIISLYFAYKTRRENIRNSLYQWYSELQKWANIVIEIMSEASFLCDLDPKKMYEQRIRILAKLTSLIDQGRFYFPNIYSDAYGQEKGIAYAGFRRKELTHIVKCYRILLHEFNFEKQTDNRDYKEKIINYKREFTSNIQDLLDPRSRAKHYKCFMKKKDLNDKQEEILYY